jgi:hypothetical protein
MGQMEMKYIFNIGKNISILAKVTRVSDVAHGPLVTVAKGKKSIWKFTFYQDLHKKKNVVGRSVIHFMMADLIRLRIESRNHHIYEVVSVYLTSQCI